MLFIPPCAFFLPGMPHAPSFWDGPNNPLKTGFRSPSSVPVAPSPSSVTARPTAYATERACLLHLTVSPGKTEAPPGPLWALSTQAGPQHTVGAQFQGPMCLDQAHGPPPRGPPPQGPPTPRQSRTFRTQSSGSRTRVPRCDLLVIPLRPQQCLEKPPGNFRPCKEAICTRGPLMNPWAEGLITLCQNETSPFLRDAFSFYS